MAVKTTLRSYPHVHIIIDSNSHPPPHGRKENKLNKWHVANTKAKRRPTFRERERSLHHSAVLFFFFSAQEPLPHWQKQKPSGGKEKHAKKNVRVDDTEHAPLLPRVCCCFSIVAQNHVYSCAPLGLLSEWWQRDGKGARGEGGGKRDLEQRSGLMGKMRTRLVSSLFSLFL